jgi:DNA-binding Lrp family transcriptional regulator
LDKFTESQKKLLAQLENGIEPCERPFLNIALQLNTSEQAIVDQINEWLGDGTLSRFGPMYNAEKMGGTFVLVALKVPTERFEEVCAIVNSFPEVAHNYEREHRYNMWFVLGTKSKKEVDLVIQEIEKKTQLKTLLLPKIQEFFLELKMGAAL